MKFNTVWRSLSENFIAWLAVGLLWLCLVVMTGGTLSLQQSRRNYEERAAVMAQNLSRLLAHEVAASVSMIDLALLSVESEVRQQKAAGGIRPQALNAYIEEQKLRQPDLGGLRVTDSAGQVLYGTAVDSRSLVRLADRDYFAQLRNDPQAGLIISHPLIERGNGAWSIVLARRINGPDASFDGMVFGVVPLHHFSRAFADLSVGSNGTFTLFDDQLSIITRRPEPGGPGSSVGLKFGSASLQELVRTGQPHGSYRARSTVDGLERIYAYRKITGTSLNVVIGLASQDYLAEWYGEVRKTLALVSVFVLVTLLLSWFTYRTWRSQVAATDALKAANRTLAAEKQLNQTIVQSSPFAIYTRDRRGIVTTWNLAAEKLFGWRAEEIVGHPLLTVPPGRERESEELRDRVLAGENLIQFEVQRQKRDGTLFDLSTTLAPTRDASGHIAGYLAIAADITERKAAERQIAFLAYRDVLTGLPNRLLLQDRLVQAMAYADRAGARVALLFLDLDSFKTINDSLGHTAGDALLKEIAQRLTGCVRDTDTISRQGGDEFLVVLPNLKDADAAVPVLAKIKEQLMMPFDIEGHELSTSVSIGVALYPDDGRDFDTLLKKADTAMYRAKDAGRNAYRFYDDQMNVDALEHLVLKNGLRRALERGEFELYYQPQVDLASGAVVGAEALLRWHHPELGMISPARFIPIAEESGLIVPIGEWVIHEACRQAVAWRQAGLPQLIMAVNLSAAQFKRGDVEQVVLHALEASGFDPACLELELTESILVHNTEQVLATVKRLKLLGLKLAIDDFGTGYSSLSYLKRFAVDKLKIDQSFVRDLATDADDAAIIRAIIQMARSLNLKTIAEGVEHASILQQLRIFQCDQVQGYLFAKPMPATEFVRYMGTQVTSRPDSGMSSLA